MFQACNKLFVYGTLQRYERLHPHLRGAPYLGTVRLDEPAHLTSMGYFPAIWDLNRQLPSLGRTTVWGELYQASPELMWHLDKVEGGYVRSIAQIKQEACWVYSIEGRTPTGRHITCGSWKAYQALRKHLHLDDDWSCT